MTKKKKTRKSRRLRKILQERKKNRNIVAESRDRLVARTKSYPFEGNVEIDDGSMAKEKMSDVIIRFAAPLMEIAKNDEEDKKALVIAIMIWNLSLIPEEVKASQRNQINKMLGISDEKDHESKQMKEFVDFMLKRKKAEFPNIHRIILDYDIVETPQGLHLNVVSNIPRNGK